MTVKMAFPKKFKKEEVDAFLAGISRGYVVIKGPRVGNLWWTWCETVKQPFVKVLVCRKYCRVELDFPCAGTGLSEESVRFLEDAVRRLGGKKTKYSIGIGASQVEGLTLKEANAIAAKFFTIAKAMTKNY